MFYMLFCEQEDLLSFLIQGPAHKCILVIVMRFRLSRCIAYDSKLHVHKEFKKQLAKNGLVCWAS